MDHSCAELLRDHTPFRQPPQAEVRTGQSCRPAVRAVRNAARHRWGLRHAPIASTAGIPWTHPPVPAGHSHAAKRPLLLALLPPGTTAPAYRDGTHRTSWWPVACLLAGQVAALPAELAAFLHSYLQEWLPDGQHALDW